MSQRARSKRKSRLSREEWLQLALDTLALEGSTKLRIDDLVKRVGVTKGSFYWHFKSRADFVRSIAEYWGRIRTQRVIDELTQMEGDARERLLTLMNLIVGHHLTSHDVTIRAWARNEPEAAKVVELVDGARIRTIRSLFAEMGFTGEDLDNRTRIFVVWMSLDESLYVQETQAKRERRLRSRHAFFTRR